MSLDLTSFAPALKTYYPPEKIEKALYENRPFLAMLPKDENFYGDSSKEPWMYGNPQNISSVFATAQGQNTTSLYKAPIVTRVKKYGFGFVDNETIKASMNDKGALLRALTSEIDNAIDGVAQALAVDATRSGTGTLGRRASASTNVITLSNPEETRNFEVGMTVGASSTDGTGAARTGTTTVAAVDSMLGTVTLASAAAITSFADNDYLFRAGDYNATMSGFSAWIPYTNRASLIAASFFGVTRSANPTRLAGVANDLSAFPIEQALVKAAMQVGAEGGRPDYGYLCFEDYEDLVNALGSKVQYTEAVTGSSQTKYGSIGFQGVKVHGADTIITVLPDRTIPPGQYFLQTSKSWKLRSLGKLADVFDTDSLPFLRQSTADGVEVRITSYANMVCRAPAWNGNFKIR